ncbi:MAG: undecaprenyl diphosphate synthase family protein, partial [Muribaculaceae bacterium]|nr:undecaprenyl diphosphate synthase family protein [Muribaculaceae bacterium]
GGDFRVSNFLLYQIAYTEIYLTPTYWPDFDDTELKKAVVAYQSRQRRFGLTGEQVEGQQ